MNACPFRLWSILVAFLALLHPSASSPTTSSSSTKLLSSRSTPPSPVCSGSWPPYSSILRQMFLINGIQISAYASVQAICAAPGALVDCRCQFSPGLDIWIVNCAMPAVPAAAVMPPLITHCQAGGDWLEGVPRGRCELSALLRPGVRGKAMAEVSGAVMLLFRFGQASYKTSKVVREEDAMFAFVDVAYGLVATRSLDLVPGCQEQNHGFTWSPPPREPAHMDSSFIRRLSGSQQQPLLPRHQQQAPLVGDAYHLEPMSPHLVTPKPVFDASASFMASSTTLQSPLLAMERKEKQLQRDLQALLDAQSEGLLAGLSGVATDDLSSNGTRTPSTSALGERGGRIVPVRQPVKKKIGLHGARRRILSTIQELSFLKSEESRSLEAEVRVRDKVLQQVEGFGKKKDGLEQEIAGIEGQDESRRLLELKDETKRVEVDIQELETKLYQMQAMHRRLTAQISELDNSVQAKLSSYTASLSIMDTRVRRFLARPPLQETGISPAQSSFLLLPPKRRTLGMARDHWLTERESLEKKRGEIEVEKGALDDGAVVWKDVVTEIGDFERRIQDELRRLGTREKTSEGENDTPNSPDEGMRKLLEQMDPVIAHIETKCKLAETRNWKLLVCCIGAELEALKEGRLLLQGTLDSVAGNRGSRSPVIDNPDKVSAETNGVPRKRGLSEDFGLQEEPQQSSALVEGLDEEDDEPDPELLISHQDTD